MTARRRPTKARLEAWKVDRLSPDNYFRIPEFGVMPADVDFVGFEDPIVAPELDHYEAREEVRDLVRNARYLARKTFRTLAKLHAAEAAGTRAMSAGLPATPEQRTAMLYVRICGNFRHAFSGEVPSRHFILELTATAIGFAGFAFWDSRFGLDKAAVLSETNRRSASGYRGDGKLLSVDDVVSFCVARPDLTYEDLIAGAVEEFGAKESTVKRRYSEAVNDHKLERRRRGPKKKIGS